jgi:hypothetical protein
MIDGVGILAPFVLIFLTSLGPAVARQKFEHARTCRFSMFLLSTAVKVCFPSPRPDFFGQGDKFAFGCHSSSFVKIPCLSELRGSVFLWIVPIFGIFTKSPVPVRRVAWFSVSCWIAYLLEPQLCRNFRILGVTDFFLAFRRPKKRPHAD